MMRRTLIAIAAVLCILGLSAQPAAAAPAAEPAVVSAVPAGNGTSNFYFTAKCGVNMPLGTWAAMSISNYDSGANQIVHTNITRSGAGIIVQVWINGIFRESGDLEDYYSAPGWGRVAVMLRARSVTSTAWYNCKMNVI